MYKGLHVCGEAENTSRVLSLHHRSPLGGGRCRVSGWPGAPQKGYPVSLRDLSLAPQDWDYKGGHHRLFYMSSRELTQILMVTEQALSPLSCLPGPWLLLLWTVKSKKNFTMMVTGTSGLGIW